MSIPTNYGYYSVKDVTRLLKLHYNRIYYYIRGYRRSGELVGQPFTLPQHPMTGNKYSLGFMNLMEIRLIKSLLTNGVKWSTIRLAHAKAKDIFDTDYPFATNRIRTDRKEIFADISEESRDKALISLVTSNYEMEDIISEYLRDVDKNLTGDIIAWWPKSKDCMIILDPKRKSGAPLIDKFGVETSTLFNAYKAEGEDENALIEVAEWYDVTKEAVLQSIKFEMELIN